MALEEQKEAEMKDTEPLVAGKTDDLEKTVYTAKTGVGDADKPPKKRREKGKRVLKSNDWSCYMLASLN